MRTFTEKMINNSVKMAHLHRTGRAFPAGPCRASEALVWLRAKTKGNVIRVGQVLKSEVRVCGS